MQEKMCGAGRIMGLVLGAWLCTLAPARADHQIVLSNWGTGMYGAPWAVAFEKGYLKPAGIDVDSIIAGQGGGTSIRNVLASDSPFGEVASTAAFAAWREGLPVVIVGATAYSFDNTWVVMKDSTAIHTIKDFVGRKVSITNPRSVTEAFLLMSLNKSGIDPAQVTRVAAGSYGQGLTLLENKGVDSAAIIEPMLTMRQDRYRIVFGVKDLLPPVLTVVLITSRDYAAKNAQEIRALIEGHRKGVDDLYANPTAAGETMAKYYKIDPAIGVESVKRMAAANYWISGKIPYDGLDAMAEAMRLVGLATGPINWHDLTDEAFLPADLRSSH